VPRDKVDTKFIETVRNNTGRVIDTVEQSAAGGWDASAETRPAGWDTDLDGIPDYWEAAVGMDPHSSNNNHLNPDGYTDLEHYLNWLADPHAVGGANLPIDVSLRTLYGDTNALAFTVANGTNGTVSLQAGGHTARFIPAPNFVGRASFQFCATNPATGIGFGPLTVGLLVTNSPAPAPRLTALGFVQGQFTLELSGSAFPNCTFQASTNLLIWTTLFTTNAPALPFRWSDPVTTNFQRRFYRVLLGP
jgi:hypothetical protein